MKMKPNKNKTNDLAVEASSLVTQYYVEVIRYSDNEVVERMGPMEARKAEQVDRGININISNAYMTQMVPA